MYIVRVPVLLHVDHGPRLLWLRPRTHRAKTFQRGYGPCRNGFWQPKSWDMLRHFARFHDRGITQLTLIQQRICNPGHFDRSFEEGPLRLCLPLPPHCGTKPWTRQAPSSSGLWNIIPMGLAFSNTIYAVLPCSTKRAAVTPLIWQIWHGSDLIIFDLLWIHAGIKRPIRTYLHTNTGHTGPPRFQGISPASAARRSSFRRAWASSSPSMGRGHRGSKSKVISAWQAKSATVTLDPSVTEAVWNMDRNGMKLWLVRINSKRGSNLWSSYVFWCFSFTELEIRSGSWMPHMVDIDSYDTIWPTWRGKTARTWAIPFLE